jgi:hypothetical protein
MPLMEGRNACLPALSRAAEPIGRSSSWKRSETPLTALAGHRRTLGRQGQSLDPVPERFVSEKLEKESQERKESNQSSSKMGSAQESGTTCDWRGFGSLSDLAAAVAGAAGIGNTRPLRVSKLRVQAEPLGQTLDHSALGAPFPQRGPVYRPFWRESGVWAPPGAE